MASSSHNGKNARTPAAAAGSSDAGQERTGEFLTTAQGLRLPDTGHSLKAGERGPTSACTGPGTGRPPSWPPPSLPSIPPDNLRTEAHDSAPRT
jgi:hypothetical protein